MAMRSVLTTREALRDPGAALRRVQEVGASAARMLAPNFTPLSPVMTGRSLSVRFDVLQVPLDDMKAAARAAGARLNDAFVAGVSGGMARYHERLGQPVDELRMAMPISIRPSGSSGSSGPSGSNGSGGAGPPSDAGALAGNQFVPTRFPVPLSIADPVERMRAVRALVGAQRAEPALSITEPVAGVLNRLPLALTTAVFGGMLRGVDFITSNVPGAPFQVFLAGAALQANYAFGPLSGAAVNITLLSNIDDLHIGVNSDPAAVADPALLLECLSEGFEEVRKTA
jgi:diacylglycerol O-acyltransferase